LINNSRYFSASGLARTGWWIIVLVFVISLILGLLAALIAASFAALGYVMQGDSGEEMGES
jgi:hypothetical protein